MSIPKCEWDECFGIYKSLKGKRFSTIRKRCKELVDDVYFLSALGSDAELSEAKGFIDFCNKQIYPLIESHGNDAGALALCSYLYCQLNSERVILAEVYSLFFQVYRSLEKVKEHKEISYHMSYSLQNMGYYIGLAEMASRPRLSGASKYNDNDRMANWPIKIPKNLNMDDLLNVAWMLSRMIGSVRVREMGSNMEFIALNGVVGSSNQIMKKLKEISEPKNTNKETK